MKHNGQRVFVAVGMPLLYVPWIFKAQYFEPLMIDRTIDIETPRVLALQGCTDGNKSLQTQVTITISDYPLTSTTATIYYVILRHVIPATVLGFSI
jgi:hypothetical protein